MKNAPSAMAKKKIQYVYSGYVKKQDCFGKISRYGYNHARFFQKTPIYTWKPLLV